jgi:phosphotransferase system IIB component
MTWVKSPNMENLPERRRRELIKELHKVEGNFDTHLGGQERIENRENCIFRLTYKGLDTVTMNKRMLHENRVQEMI